MDLNLICALVATGAVYDLPANDLHVGDLFFHIKYHYYLRCE